MFFNHISKNITKIATIGSVLVMGGGLLGGCGATGLSTDSGSSTSKVEKKAPSKLKIGVSISTLSNPVFITLKNELQKYSDKKGSKIIINNANNDTSKQNNDVEDLIQQKVDAIIVNPCDSSAISTVIQKANDAKIPVICIDRGADRGTVVSTVASDNVAGGKMAANFLIKKLGLKAKIAELQGIPGASATRERGEGFDKIADKKLDIVSKQTAQFDRAKGLSVTENILQAHHDVKGIFSQNDEMAVGAARAVKASKKNIIIIGFDGTNDALKLIKSGQITATIAQQWDKMADTSLDAVYDYYQGKTVKKNNLVPVRLITKENVDSMLK
ncbi:ABC transporter substrate binding protein [Lactobacillus mulieris]|jgi:D-ribose-binding protein|nr:ABC transporter substrate binding protein [Lactobacillus mulieris]KAA9371228.1 D-ribose ABC transporter substrate-binding protein [Lactobacillus jensenii]MCF1797851.1 substrate-binding domain-containing protein [Lactobacillus mulieris]MCW8073614.1 substrate-binding domain-containing protein [Lactobacillus mulieris]MCW8106598.1 substrate-binding domain-containing protein [Lactobacillus mulieris]MDK6269213.1 ABC transporter substrate binding protein [Lactobacillus mulieris]